MLRVRVRDIIEREIEEPAFALFQLKNNTHVDIEVAKATAIYDLGYHQIYLSMLRNVLVKYKD